MREGREGGRVGEGEAERRKYTRIPESTAALNKYEFGSKSAHTRADSSKHANLVDLLVHVRHPGIGVQDQRAELLVRHLRRGVRCARVVDKET